MPNEQTDIEARVRILERMVGQIQRMLRNALEMARRALETAGQAGGSYGGGGAEIHRAIVSTDIPAPATAAAPSPFGYAQVQRMDPATGAWASHPAFPAQEKVWNPWPGATTTATAGKVVMVFYQDGAFRLMIESC